MRIFNCRSNKTAEAIHAKLIRHHTVAQGSDTCVLDWLLFPNIKRVRLPGTGGMDKEYHQKWFHVKVMIPVIPVAVRGHELVRWHRL